MRYILAKVCSALIVSCLLSASGSKALAVGLISHDRASADSIRKQQRIQKQLNFISDEIIPHVEEVVGIQPLPELIPLTVEGRLKKLESEIPMPYNAEVRRFIERYSADRYRSHLSRMTSLGQYYFKVYDRVFEETGLPRHLKYLSVVESALNPHAVSRMGATGPWQFMFATARELGLQIDSDMDERKDPVAASYAASRYLLGAYEQFGDWLLAIAAYNCGPGNVMRAIRRSGLKNPDFWTISRYLPRETRDYVPAFIAMTYMLEYHQLYDITPSEYALAIPTEMVSVQQHVTFSAIAEALEMDEAIIRDLNPAYKKDQIKGSMDQPRRLILPVVDPRYYADLYVVLNEVTPRDDVPGRLAATSQPERSTESSKRLTAQHQTYTVRKGDSLSAIAARHRGATVASIKAANGLKSDRINPGMILKIK